MRGFLLLEMQGSGKKRSKIRHLARLFNAAEAFSGAKYTINRHIQNTPRPPDKLEKPVSNKLTCLYFKTLETIFTISQKMY
ncbi:hypothetical protein LVJ83_02325 [Uruburuella testudinis]|uniref:Uncharacterized protein n=1 Tax=Uruburuella testudinis TaxID=1282863 RepID=A0ABY4DTZ4_9NEIS|nr:hypothetical protein [Uruburuella testudinis]UOO82331.1 hypothetical protein LVJ83_02325 [Uruburuella testudinis]